MVTQSDRPRRHDGKQIYGTDFAHDSQCALLVASVKVVGHMVGDFGCGRLWKEKAALCPRKTRLPRVLINDTMLRFSTFQPGCAMPKALTFEDWKSQLRQNCDVQGKTSVFASLGDIVLRLFWERGIEPTPQAIVEDGAE